MRNEKLKLSTVLMLFIGLSGLSFTKNLAAYVHAIRDCKLIIK